MPKVFSRELFHLVAQWLKGRWLGASSFARRLLHLLRTYTPVTVFIRLALGHRRNTWALASCLYGIPVFLVLSGFLFARKAHISHDALTVALVFLAALWTWVGPVFIWRYEHITSVNFWAMCRKVVKDKKRLQELRNRMKRSVLFGGINPFLIAVWCILIIVTFISSYDFMIGFGVTGKQDVWWYVQVLGVSVYAFITGIGFLMVLRTFSLIRNFLPLNVIINPYHPDQRGGLGFFGRLLAETSFMFASGALFVPILMKLHVAMYAEKSIIVLVIIGIYVLMIALSFMVPIWLIHKKLMKEKLNMLQNLSISLKQFQGWLNEEGVERYWKYRTYRDQYEDVSRIITWPFDTYNLTTAAFSVTLPVVLTVLQIFFSR